MTSCGFTCNSPTKGLKAERCDGLWVSASVRVDGVALPLTNTFSRPGYISARTHPSTALRTLSAEADGAASECVT